MAGTKPPALHFSRMPKDKVYDEPSEVTAEEGVVLVDGPDGVAVAITPDAAEKTADRLFEGAVTARGQETRNRRDS